MTSTSSLATASAASVAWLGTWSRPPDAPAQAALACAALLLAAAFVPGGPEWLASLVDVTAVADFSRRRRFLTVTAFVAALLSLGYIAFYLSGGPRAPDAAGYWVEARALSHGHLAWDAPAPLASFRSQHVVLGGAGVPQLTGVFPPGFPLLLALGFLVGAPMIVGPLIGALLVVATWSLAREVADGAGERAARVEPIARVAVGLSVVSAALRYHTAEALPFGAAALALVTAVAFSFRGLRTGDARLFGVAGAGLGLLVAAQPASALPAAILVLFCALRSADRLRALLWTYAASLPGTLLLVAANHRDVSAATATWHALLSPLAAGNIDAFSGLSGHQAFVRALRTHFLGICNLEPLALLALLAFSTRGPRRWCRGPYAVAFVIFGHLAINAPTWGGTTGVVVASSAAPLPLDTVLPLEQVLVALGLARLPLRRLAPAAMTLLSLALAGFALHASHDHSALAASDLGRPRFEPDVLRDANVTQGLLFFDDDIGYELACDPSVAASHGVEAVRRRGDDHDRLLYDWLGHPPVHRYVATEAHATAPPWSPPSDAADVWRFEAEADFPPVDTTGALVDVVREGEPCASEGRALLVTPARGTVRARATIPLPLPRAAGAFASRPWLVTPRIIQRRGAGTGELELAIARGGTPLARWTWANAATSPLCVDLPSQAIEVPADAPTAWLVVSATGAAVELDRTTFRPP